MRVRGLFVGLASLASLASLATLALATTARGQTAAQTGLVPIPNRTYVGINPLGIPFNIFTVEMESGVARGITLGGNASYVDVDHDRYKSLDFKVRYYPANVVLQGFSLGGTVGMLNYHSTDCCGPTGDEPGRSLSRPTIGVITDYNWLLGLDQRFVIGTGLGAKRVLGSSAARDAVSLNRAYFTARFIVGFAF